MSEFPSEIVIEILNQIPTTSLCRFKCVSKPWCFLIQHQLTPHKAATPPFKCLISEDGSSCAYIYTIDKDCLATKQMLPTPLGDFLFFNKHCNGLIFNIFRKDNRLLHVFNPTTNESFQFHIPSYLGLDEDSHDQMDINIGFVPTSNKYKVLHWKRSDQGDWHFLKILTLGENAKWRSVRSRIDFLLPELPHCVTSVNGGLYWDDFDYMFDLVTEKFRVIELPSVMDKYKFDYSWFEFEGCLCWVEREIGRLGIANLWMLKTVGNGVWVRVMSNVVLPMEGTNLCAYFANVPGEAKAYFSACNGELFIASRDDKDQYIFTYSFVNGRFNRIKISGIDCGQDWVKSCPENHVSFRKFV